MEWSEDSNHDETQVNENLVQESEVEELYRGQKRKNIEYVDLSNEPEGTIWKKMKRNKDDVKVVYQSELVFPGSWGACSNIFYCQTCNARMNSKQILQSHFQGKRHKRKVEALKFKRSMDKSDSKCLQRLIKVTGCPQKVDVEQLTSSAKIQTYIDEYQDAPIIGLGFVTEVQLLERILDPVYICSLCPVECQMVSLINHVTGFQHRMAYVKLCEPDIEKEMNKSQEDTACIIEEKAAYYEKIDGRGSMIVERQLDERQGPRHRSSERRILPQLPNSAITTVLRQVDSMEPEALRKLINDMGIEMANRLDLTDRERSMFAEILS